jgi:pyruvate,orthophosphate dikinase
MTDLHFIGGRQSDAALTAALVGNKAANLARLDALGLRVPPAIALTTAASRSYGIRGRLPDGFSTALSGSLRQLEEATGLTFGGRSPLLLSVRSSPAASMPGMLESVLNVGLNEDTVRGLIRRTGNPWLAWDAYRRFIRSFATAVRGLPLSLFDQVERDRLGAAGALALNELDPLAMRDLAREHVSLLRGRSGAPVPVEPDDQLLLAVDAVLRSWTSARAIDYRRRNGIDDDSGTGVLIQAMVFGNAGPQSGAGVGFTRNPATGADELYVDFVFNAQGDDVVSGRHALTECALLASVLPGPYAELLAARPVLERALRDMQDFEFTIEEGKVYFLQTRDAKRTPWAALQVAVDLVAAGIIEPATALARLAPFDLDALHRKVATPGAGTTCLATGVPASPGTVAGAIALSIESAQAAARSGPVVLVRHNLATDDFEGLAAASGLLTTLGGRTSHAAVVARQLDRPSVVGCAELHVDEPAHGCVIGGRRMAEGEVITIDGDTGRIYAGAVPVVTERPDDLLATVRGWTAAVAS